MFGIAVARLDKVSDEEKMRYQALYCGLCRTLKDRYGQISRAALSYDLAFLVMLYNSLYEPEETCGLSHCITHPKKKMSYATSVWSDYAADLSVAFAYHKCLDDIDDDNTMKAKAAAKLLKPSYESARKRIPMQCDVMEDTMASIRLAEASKDSSPDETSKAFGELLGALFSYDQGVWTDYLYQFGAKLGEFIYLMDAAVDYEDDKKKGSYNPFLKYDIDPENLREILTNIIGEAAKYFEMLPLVKDANLMRSVIYSGVWQKFNQIHKNMEQKPS